MQQGKPKTNSTTTDRDSPALMFFNVVARVIPSEPTSGAREAGVVIYIDRAVAGEKDMKLKYQYDGI
jgi:hypothetical protein